MKASTRQTHEHVATIGQAIGFTVGREVSDSLLKVRLDEAYQPRVDLLWSVPLDNKQRAGISWAIGRPIDEVTHLPIVGIEVEGSMPTTKTMAADLANLAALGAPLGLLVVSELGERNIYRRAVRAVRSVRRAHGDLHILPVEAEWLTECVQNGWKMRPPDNTDLLVAKKRPAGGETREWSRSTRETIRKMGQDAGFVVAEPFVPPTLSKLFDLAHHRAGPLGFTANPMTGESGQMTKHGDYLTRCEIDLAWTMPLPPTLQSFLQECHRRDPFLQQEGIVFPELWTHVPVVGFEVESSGGKHAGGGLLNLAAYCTLGITAVPDKKTAEQISSTIKTYQPTLGLRNIFVKAIS